MLPEFINLQCYLDICCPYIYSKHLLVIIKDETATDDLRLSTVALNLHLPPHKYGDADKAWCTEMWVKFNQSGNYKPANPLIIHSSLQCHALVVLYNPCFLCTKTPIGSTTSTLFYAYCFAGLTNTDAKGVNWYLDLYTKHYHQALLSSVS